MENNEELLRRIEELEKFVKSLRSANEIPLEFAQAITARFMGTTPSLSSKGATSENQAVNEGGTGQYSVMAKPDGFLQVVLNGVIYYLPYFT